jgi:hypothetical protein
MRTNKLIIELVDFGIANRSGNKIIVNKNIFKYPAYADKVLNHEKRHTSKDFTMKDLKMDMFEGDLWDNLKFCLRHPKGFLQFFPVIFHKKNIYVDLNMLIIYIIMVVSIWVFLKL